MNGHLIDVYTSFQASAQVYIHQRKSITDMKQDEVPRPCACTSVRRAARVLARTYDASLVPSGMNITQLAVMRAVLRHPGEPLSRVAENLEMDRTSLYRAIDSLERKRWVSLRNEGDHRSHSASVTERGHAALAKVDPDWAQVQTAIVDRFGRANWKTFASELQRLIECADAVASSQSSMKGKP
jgi:DNA-binding MarR family transcriptional regulator